MKEYFIAIELPYKPFMRYQSIGKFTDEEFEESDYFNNPLVFDETTEPAYQFNVCSQHIVAGEIVDFTPAELAVFEAEYLISDKLKSNRLSLDVLETSSFYYDGQSFPMDQASRLFYTAFEKVLGNQKIMTMSAELYTLVEADITAFMTAYYTQLRLITKHDI